MLLPPLILKGVLFLSIAQPIEVPLKSNQLWFSKQDVVTAQVLGNRVALKAAKEGIVFASGLGLAGSLQKIMVLNPASFQALKNCGLQGLEIAGDTPTVLPASFSEATLRRFKNCGFEGLALTEENQKSIAHTLFRLEALLNKQGMRVSKNTWNSLGQRELTVIGAPNDNHTAKAKEVLGAFAAIYKIQSQNRAQPGRTLTFETTLFEFSRSKARSLGFRFPESIKLAPIEAGALQDMAGAALSLGLDFGEQEGISKILARPKIRTKPGEKAIFQSGGEIPIKYVSLHSSKTDWKSYGLQIEIEPDASLETGSSEISLSFKIEVSEPDYANALDGTPAMTTRKLTNRFDLRTNETTVLTSLIQLRRGNVKKGLPGLREIPLVGGIFDNHSKDESESELYFALYPTWEEIL